MLYALELGVNLAFDGELARIDGAVLADAMQDPRCSPVVRCDPRVVAQPSDKLSAMNYLTDLSHRRTATVAMTSSVL